MPGADAKCQGLVEAAGVPGTHKAWLADQYGSPAAGFARSATPYQLVDGTIVANDWADLTSGNLRHAIDRDESGGPQQTSHVWSNADTAGQPIAPGNTFGDCLNWSFNDDTYEGLAGHSSATDDKWTEGDVGGCFGSLRLYCFQQPAAV
ncbi:MAG TPA: hypothetical protein VFI22_19510 [Thermomicrobiales bacterium]|nr:hypothetical protein [Thermomicrobiales bacterium]